MTLPIADRQKFFSILNSARNQGMPTDYCMMNLALFSSMFPELKQKLSGSDDEIIISGVKIQLSLYSNPDMIYFKDEPFDVHGIDVAYKYSQLK
jgi:hypothetical protein